jgi:hypothetical protein
MGQSILSERYAHDNNIDISLLPNGIYFVSIKGAEQNISPKKLIISR